MLSPIGGEDLNLKHEQQVPAWLGHRHTPPLDAPPIPV